MPHLIGFGLALVVLNVDSGISYPRRFENSVTRGVLAGAAKVLIADLHEICEPDIGRLSTHLLQNPFGVRHGCNGINSDTISQPTPTPTLQGSGEVEFASGAAASARIISRIALR